MPKNNNTIQDRRWMRQALRLARRGLGKASPNPLVGCLVVREGSVVGQGFHTYADVKHAEAIALQQAGDSARGSELYVTLEPCCHEGRTPPCVEQIIAAGVRRVVVAVRDPNPLVSGRGIERLQEAGLKVELGVLEPEAKRLNESFFHFIQTGRPFVTLKLGMTLDGKIATARGQSKWITGERARQHSHRLRFENDAILVGIETLLQDDPSLTVRWRKRNRLTRVILDSNLRTPVDARVFQTDDPVIIFHRKNGSLDRGPLPRQAEFVPVDRAERGLSWHQVLAELGRRQVSSLIVEGGSRAAASALAEGVVQKVCFFYATKIIGGNHLSGIGDVGIRNLEQALRLQEYRLRSLGTDFLLEGYMSRPGAASGNSLE